MDKKLESIHDEEIETRFTGTSPEAADDVDTEDADSDAADADLEDQQDFA